MRLEQSPQSPRLLLGAVSIGNTPKIKANDVIRVAGRERSVVRLSGFRAKGYRHDLCSCSEGCLLDPEEEAPLSKLICDEKAASNQFTAEAQCAEAETK
jgi:hypothetical protein